MPEAFTITTSERDALYDQVLARLSGFGDLWLEVKGERFDEAERLGRELSDDLLLVSAGLGWGDGDGEKVELRLPAGVLRRALSRHCGLALDRDATEVPERTELQEEKERNEEIVKACRHVLAELDRTEERRGAAEL